MARNPSVSADLQLPGVQDDSLATLWAHLHRDDGAVALADHHPMATFRLVWHREIGLLGNVEYRVSEAPSGLVHGTAWGLHSRIRLQSTRCELQIRIHPGPSHTGGKDLAAIPLREVDVIRLGPRRVVHDDAWLVRLWESRPDAAVRGQFDGDQDPVNPPLYLPPIAFPFHDLGVAGGLLDPPRDRVENGRVHRGAVCRPSPPARRELGLAESAGT